MNSERQNNSANLTKRKTVQDLLYELKNPRKPQMKKCKSLRPELDVESIRSKMKQKWRDPGYCNLQFKKPPILRQKMLNQWECQRIPLADRSYKYPKNYKGYKFNQQSRQFEKPNNSLFSAAFQKFLEKHQTIKANQNQFLYEAEKTHTQKREKILRMLTENGVRTMGKKKILRQGFFGHNKTKSSKLKTINI